MDVCARSGNLADVAPAAQAGVSAVRRLQVSWLMPPRKAGQDPSGSRPRASSSSASSPAAR
jgi:hypothetical protein